MATAKAAKEEQKREIAPNEFPKMLYHKGNVKTQKIVSSPEEEDALGDEWYDAPVDTPSAA